MINLSASAKAFSNLKLHLQFYLLASIRILLSYLRQSLNISNIGNSLFKITKEGISFEYKTRVAEYTEEKMPKLCNAVEHEYNPNLLIKNITVT